MSNNKLSFLTGGGGGGGAILEGCGPVTNQPSRLEPAEEYTQASNRVLAFVLNGNLTMKLTKHTESQRV